MSDDLRLGIVERAYQIARSGRAKTLADVTALLKEEGYTGIAQQLVGVPVLRKELRDLCTSAHCKGS